MKAYRLAWPKQVTRSHSERAPHPSASTAPHSPSHPPTHPPTAVWSLSVEGVAELLRAPLLLDKHERRAFQCATASAPVLVLLRSHQEAAHEVLMGEVRLAGV